MKYLILLCFSFGLALAACGQPPPQSPLPKTLIDFNAPRVIYFLAPLGTVHGRLNAINTSAQGWTHVTTWNQLRAMAIAAPPEAIVMDLQQIHAASDADRQWLRAQFDRGVVVISVGANFDDLARALNTPTLLNENENPNVNPKNLYILVYQYLTGTPHDIARMEQQYPEASVTRTPGIVLDRAGRSSGQRIGNLENPKEIELLFSQLEMTIDSIRQQRAEYNAMGKFQPLYHISEAENELPITYRIQDGVTFFDVQSEKGIGSANIVLAAPNTPKKIILWLHLKGLESLKLGFGENEIQVSVSAHGDNAVTQRARVNGAAAEIELTPTSEFWMPTEIIAQNKTIPLQDGYFQVELPRAFLKGNAREFSIEWIDFYR